MMKEPLRHAWRLLLRYNCADANPSRAVTTCLHLTIDNASDVAARDTLCGDRYMHAELYVYGTLVCCLCETCQGIDQVHCTV